MNMHSLPGTTACRHLPSTCNAKRCIRTSNSVKQYGAKMMYATAGRRYLVGNGDAEARPRLIVRKGIQEAAQVVHQQRHVHGIKACTERRRNRQIPHRYMRRVQWAVLRSTCELAHKPVLPERVCMCVRASALMGVSVRGPLSMHGQCKARLTPMCLKPALWMRGLRLWPMGLPMTPNTCNTHIAQGDPQCHAPNATGQSLCSPALSRRIHSCAIGSPPGGDRGIKRT